MKDRSTILIAILPMLICFALLPGARAVDPVPDGCYPNFTTAEGCYALNSLTSGVGNTGVGWYSLYSNSIANYNTSVGAGALVFTSGAGADFNTATGAGAMLLNTTGTQNVANGTDTLVYNVNGNYNDAVGAFALFNNSSGSGNNAVGNAALLQNVQASYNTAIGDLALMNNDLHSAGTANFNTAVGSGALAANTDGGLNTAVGVDTFANNTTGIGNTALGWDAGSNVITANNVICIGAAGADVDNSCFIGNIFGSTSPNGVAVLVNPDGRLGTMTSSARFKDEIKPMNKRSESLLALKPVTFRYKKDIDPSGRSQFGLVAEDVEKVNPDLVVRDTEGKPYSVRYDQVNAMLLNEFLKEHRKTEKLEATVVRQQKQIEALTAAVQKVSAQLEASKPAPQTALNNR